tara:strand:- start:3975 stop:4694 length:720 start_codon:yes stop_codon:yes gene_type:complete
MNLFLLLLIFIVIIILFTIKSKFININEQFYYVENELLTDEECNLLINNSIKNLTRSTVNSIDNNNNFKSIEDNSRTSRQTWLNKYSYPNIINKVIKFINKYTNYPINISNFEDIQIANYKPNQEYKYHYDICHPTQAKSNIASCKAEFKDIKSVRYLTVIVYLNSDFKGGETKFTKLNIKINPKKRKALLFFNCNLQKDSSKTGLCDVIDNSEHAGLPVINGEKWIANFWIRLKSFKK